MSAGRLFDSELGLTEFAGTVLGPGDVERLAAGSD